jgi:hypothetical protein
MRSVPIALSREERLLVHQVHPAKLATDIGASVVSNVLLWRQHAVAGLGVRYLAPVVGSAMVLSLADVERLSTSRAGQHVLRHMPPVMMALRLAGDSLMAAGAWSHRWPWIAVGALVIGVGWSHGLLSHRV